MGAAVKRRLFFVLYFQLGQGGPRCTRQRMKAAVSELRQRFGDRFYRNYLWYTATETNLLFFVVCDAMFLTEVKHLSMEQVSLSITLSLIFALLVQYPLLKVINRIGNRSAVRVGSILFLMSPVLTAAAPNFFVILLSGFLKCIGHTFNAIGTAVMKNRLSREGCGDQYVSWQSDASGAGALLMMATSLVCGALYRADPYYPAVACILFCVTGVIAAYRITEEEQPAENTGTVYSLEQFRLEHRHISDSIGLLIFISFAIVSALTGSGLTYVRLNFQELLAGQGSGFVVSLLSIVSTLVYLLKFLSNVIMRKGYYVVGDRAAVIISALLVTGLLLQTIPWLIPAANLAAMLFTGYLMLAFVRDPYITLVQNITLETDDNGRQQARLIALNASKKAGPMLLSAAATLLLKSFGISSVMILMTAAACLNLMFCFIIIDRKKKNAGI